MLIDYEDPEEGPGYTNRQLFGQTGVDARRVYYYVQRGLIPKAEGSGPAARWNDDHVARLLVIDILKTRGLSLREIRVFLDGHTLGQIDSFAAREDPSPAIYRLRRFFQRPPRPFGTLARMKIVEGMELYVSDKFLPRAAVRMNEIEQALDKIFEFDDEEMKPIRRRAWSKEA